MKYSIKVSIKLICSIHITNLLLDCLCIKTFNKSTEIFNRIYYQSAITFCVFDSEYIFSFSIYTDIQKFKKFIAQYLYHKNNSHF